MMAIEKTWSYGNKKKGFERNRAPIFLYLFYNKDIYQEANDALVKTVEDLNSKYDDFKARAQHKANPEMELGSNIEKLINDEIIQLDNVSNRFVLNPENARNYCHEKAVWALASSIKFESTQAFYAYRERNNIEVMYRYLKDQVDAPTMNVSSETSFTGKLFVSLLASEFLNTVNLKIKKYNEQVPLPEKIKLKSNSLSMTFKDLDLVECTQYEDQIIPKTNLSKNYEKLFALFEIDPIELKTNYYQAAGFE